MKYIAALLIVLFCSASADESFRWIDADGNTVPDDASRKSTDGFGGWLLITPDHDWMEKWATPVEHIPAFTVTKRVEKGDEIYILVLFSNPQPDRAGYIDIGCDIKVTRPDGSTSVDVKDMDCAGGRVEGNLQNIRMTNLSITHVAEDSDLTGEWSIDVDVVDRIRDARVSLSANYNVLKSL